MERSQGSFFSSFRIFRLLENVEIDKVNGKIEKGVNIGDKLCAIRLEQFIENELLPTWGHAQKCASGSLLNLLVDLEGYELWLFFLN